MRSKKSTALLAALLTLSAGFALRTVAAAEPPDGAAGRAEHRADDLLSRQADRLEIRASQQSAWSGYETAVKALLAEHAHHEPPGGAQRGKPADQDPAERLRREAQQASEHAQHLSQLADATARLEGVLSADQKAVLVELSHRHRRQGFGHQHFGGGQRPHRGPGQGRGFDRGPGGQGGPGGPGGPGNGPAAAGGNGGAGE